METLFLINFKKWYTLTTFSDGERLKKFYDFLIYYKTRLGIDT